MQACGWFPAFRVICRRNGEHRLKNRSLFELPAAFSSRIGAMRTDCRRRWAVTPAQGLFGVSVASEEEIVIDSMSQNLKDELSLFEQIRSECNSVEKFGEPFPTDGKRVAAVNKFWPALRSKLPLLATVATIVLGGAATSTANESLQSVVGFVSRKQRVSMKPETVKTATLSKILWRKVVATNEDL